MSLVPRIAPRIRRNLLGAGILLSLPFFFPGWMLFSMPRLPGADLPLLHLPHQRFIHDNLRQGVIPLWNPYSYGGTPEFGNPERAPLYPLHSVCLRLCGPETMLRVKYLFHLGLAGVGCFLLLRALRVPVWISLLGGCILQASGWQVTKIMLPTVGDSASYIPLMLFLNLWFARRPSLGRALAFSLAGGCMLLMFFPQINLTLLLALAVFGGARFVKVQRGDRERRSRRMGLGPSENGQKPALQAWARALHVWILPATECVLLLSLLRYPQKAIHFPEPGWRNAFGGMGVAGVAALILVPAGWAALLVLQRIRARIEWRKLGRWAARFAGVWLLAAALAAPQLAVTGQMISHSNQRLLRYERDEDFFTGAQAYGSVRDFVQKSALAEKKESVNNMAIGPGIYLLATAGILFGLHRRNRFFFLLLGAVALTGVVYMAAPGVFDVFRRLPFFGKFAGLSRYLAFLNVFLVVLGVYGAHLLLRLLKPRFAPAGRVLVALLLLLSLAPLLRHEWRYWKAASEQPPIVGVPDEVAAQVRRHLGPQERILVDPRTRREAEQYALMMSPLAQRLPTLPEYAPMRTERYDRWMRAHNASLGVNRDDYRAGFFEPEPSPWTRASRVRLFLYPPESDPSPNSLVRAGEIAGWKLFEDTQIPPLVWPEADLARNPPLPAAPQGWEARAEPLERSGAGAWDETSLPQEGRALHRRGWRILNPAAECWAVIPQAWDPAWSAWVNGKRTETARAYDFLTAVRVPTGESRIRLEYRPRSFALGWVGFLWGTWIWVVLCAVAAERRKGCLCGATLRRFSIYLAVMGIAPVVLIAGRVLFRVPDSLRERGTELLLTLLLAAATGLLLRMGFARRVPRPRN